MEPFSALAVATGVVTFVDFASKLVSGSREIYKSDDGRFEEHADLRQISSTLEELSKDLRRPLNADKSSKSAPELRKLCDSANEVATELIKVLDSIQNVSIRNRRWSSCKQALESKMKGGQITRLAGRLEDCRRHITLHIVVILSSDMNSRLDTMMTIFREQIIEQKQRDEDLVKIIREQSRPDLDYDAPDSSWPEIITGGLRAHTRKFSQLLLRSLNYKEMEDRHDRITSRYRQTFEWIFHEDGPDPTPAISWDSFSKWLKASSQLYWITGKPGAGKSTLMKFLDDDPRTKQQLLSDLPVVKASFYFWNSGEEIQMSQHGLIQSLLYQMIDQCRETATVVFPDHWESFSLLGSPIGRFTWNELLRGFLRFIDHIGSSKQFIFLIDGLDEYEGEKRELITFLKQLLSLPNSKIKMCVSSRPWPVFEDEFETSPSLQIHELTLPDLRQFISTSFEENAGYGALKIEDPRYAAKLTEDIVQKASGVFLWVSLVVHVLLDGLSDGDNVRDLQNKVDMLPPDLENFFQKILDSQEPRHKEHASQLFQIFWASRTPISVLSLTYADQDVDYIFNHPVWDVGEEALASKIDRMRRRLNSRCKGLLDVPKRYISYYQKVEYLHRTVRDFMEKESTWKSIKAMAPTFDPHTPLYMSHLMSLKTTKHLELDYMGTLTKDFAYHMSATLTDHLDTPIRALDQLNSTLVQLTSSQRERRGSLLEYHADADHHGNAEPHWTHIKSFIPKDCTLYGPGTFLNYIVACGFLWYLEEKTEEAKPLTQKKDLVPLLLEAAVRSPVFANFEKDVNLKIVRFLLQHGADPGELYKKKIVIHHIRERAAVNNEAVRKDVLQEIDEWISVHGLLSVEQPEEPKKSKRLLFHRFNFLSRKTISA
ncbi:uncharacterized protein BDZ99DRAFT_561448 [Mytilinidion resinicola]|uniref:NACHT domain-containing protein n=1 Tax=Mytilinidion resinicola TaxID=574789 RepID=A0A6A6YQT8_9PEZI|nr:uncharacterized protein BDZ99DRAFT_561448 [Mytilinidion resinicola]KAF2810879.1 hypothetical protein BDZ99DRAFT_561448 [Mytilinidion resinicola]